MADRRRLVGEDGIHGHDGDREDLDLERVVGPDPEAKLFNRLLPQLFGFQRQLVRL